MPSRFWMGALLLAGSAGAVAPEGLFVPTGAKIEASGFATIESVAATPLPDEPPPSDFRPRGEDAWYARDVGISVAEAAKRRAEQEALRPEFERLLTVLRQKESGNFTAPRIEHKPDWAYVFYFKRDPERTLGKYASNPRFKAGLARYSRDELQAMMEGWMSRFQAEEDLFGGWGSDETHGRAHIMVNATEEEFPEIARRNGVDTIPDWLELQFGSPLRHASVEDRVRPFIRIFPQNDRSTGVQLLAAATGRIFMRDGCLMVSGGDGKESLAFFHRETGIGIDDQGYVALKDRKTGESKGRVGEWFTWAGPNGVREDSLMIKELRSRCGNRPIANVGNPDSTNQSRARPSLVDSVAIDRRVSRKKAWELLKRCWEREEAAAGPKRPPRDHCSL